MGGGQAGSKTPKRIRNTCMAMRVGVALMATATAAPLPAMELLRARITRESGDAIYFSLTGENRDDVVGGTIELGSRTFTITRVSRSGLIGASRFGAPDTDTGFAEFAVFSSAFSSQTAVGQPWISARGYSGCDSPYNSFLAIYRVEGEKAIAGLGPTPYPRLAENVTSSQSSHVYCFVSTPPGDG